MDGKGQVLWMGKPVRSMTREELIEALEVTAANDWQRRQELARRSEARAALRKARGEG